MPVEFSKGEAGLGQQEINLRYSEALEQADRNVLYKHAAKEIAWAAGEGGHLHGEVGRAATPARARTSTSACGTRTASGTAFRATGRSGRSQAQRHLPLVPGRLDAARARARRLLRALRRLLQALPVALLGADRHRLELRQPHRRLPRGRPRPLAARRVPHARARTPTPTSPTPPPSPPASTASATASSRRPIFAGRHLRGAASCRASRTPCARRSTSSSGATFAREAFGDGRGRALPPLPAHRAAEVRRGRDLLGAGAVFRTGLEAIS